MKDRWLPDAPMPSIVACTEHLVSAGRRDTPEHPKPLLAPTKTRRERGQPRPGGGQTTLLVGEATGVYSMSVMFMGISSICVE